MLTTGSPHRPRGSVSQGITRFIHMTFINFYPPDDPYHPLRGRSLRYILLHELSQRSTMTVAEMVAVLVGQGFTFTDRPSKVISDALRWEVGPGRVRRLRRGVYAYRRHRVATSRLRRARNLARRARTFLLDQRLGLTPPPTPPDRGSETGDTPEPPIRPPWATLRWLWCT